MRQNGVGTLTLEDARTWIEETGLCLFLPRKQFATFVAPSFVEAVAGERSSAPAAKIVTLAEDLLVRLETDGVAVRLNLQGQPGAGPAIDRNKGLHDVLDQHKDKYKIVFEQTAEFDRVKGLSVTEAALSTLKTPPDVIVAANDDMILGAMEAVKARNLSGKIVLIGFDALPEALSRIKDGSLTATVEQFPGLQSSKALDKLVAFLRNGTKPDPKVELLTPITITKDNFDKAERLNEIQ